MDLSIVIPVFNEQGNVSRQHKRILTTVPKKLKYEMIFIDDGSTDGTYHELLKLKPVTILKLRRNFGQTAALVAGIDQAKGDVIVTMDGDCQEDPADIPRLMEKLDRYDVVCGWRFPRRDSLQKKAMSKLASLISRILVKSPVHDVGCTFRAYKKECIKGIELYGEMHRHIPSLLNWKGYRVGEVKVRHYPRRFGQSKYNLNRLIKGFLDMLNVLFWKKYSTRPLHLFGGLGLILTIIGSILLSVLVLLRLLHMISLSKSLLPLLAIFLIIIGIQFLVSGLMSDIIIKNYFESTNKKIYSIRQIVRK